MKIYLASSWRNTYQADVLAELRAAGFQVYDFKNPAPGNTGAGWKQIDPDLMSDLSVDRMRRVLSDPIAVAAFKLDSDAMRWADACVLLLPSGMSAHIEAAWIGGSGRPVVMVAPERRVREPELMWKCFDINGSTPLYATTGEAIDHLQGLCRYDRRSR